MTTIGERLLRRPLKKYKVAGVDHFMPGQHGAFELDGITYLGFVNQFGHAVNVPFERKDGELVPVGVYQTAGQATCTPIQSAQGGLGAEREHARGAGQPHARAADAGGPRR